MTNSAFPWQVSAVGGETVNDDTGMTLRDYFAAKALAGLLAEYVPDGCQVSTHVICVGHDYKGRDSESRYAFASYKLADAMMKAGGYA